MQCANGHDLADQQKFCPECGAPAIPAPAPEADIEHTQILPMPPATSGWPSPEQSPPTRGWQSLSKAARWGTLAALALVLAGSGTTAALLVTQSKSTEPGVSTWLCLGTTQDVLIQWPNNGGVISGTYQYAQLSGDTGNQQVSATSGSVTGQTSGSALTINLGDRGDWYGSIHGNQMTLNIPQQGGSIEPATCHSSTLAEWNQTIASLNGQGVTANASASAAAAAQQQAQALANAQTSLSNDVNTLAADAHALDTDKTLATDVQTANKDLATEQNDWAAEQQDSCSNLTGDSDGVTGDSDGVSGDVDGLTSDITAINNSLSGVKQDISAVEADVASIQQQGATPQTDPTRALATGTSAVAHAEAAVAWATQQATRLTSTSQAIAQQASDFANAHAC